MTAPLGRLLTAMITPMTPSGEVDFEGVKRLAKALVASGTEGIVSTGSTGEAAALSEEETIAVWRATKEAVGPDVAVIAGATNNDHRASLRLTCEAVKARLDAVLFTVPAYSKPPQAGLVRHFTALADAAEGLPCVLYNIPGRSALNMTVETTLRLAEVPNIVGVKESSEMFGQIGEIIARAPSGFRVWSGNDTDTLTVMALGGFGVVSVASHLVGRQIRAQVEAACAGRMTEASAIHHRLMPLINALFVESNPIPVKYAVAKAGLPAGPPRLPLIEVSDAARARVDAAMAQVTIDIGK